MASKEEIEHRFRAISDWCYQPQNPYFAGWPNFQVARYPQPDRIVYGHHLLMHADAADVPANLYQASDLRTMFVAAHDIARQRGYEHGFPNFHQDNPGHGVVYGTIFLPKGSCYWVDAYARDLGLGEGDPTEKPMDEWFRGASSWAYDRKLPPAMPNGNYAQYSDGWKCGLMVITTAESADIRGRELGLPDLNEHYLGKPGWIEANLRRGPNGEIQVWESDIDLVLRTYNVCGTNTANDLGLPSLAHRIPRAADKFHADWRAQLGIVGLQEAGDRVKEYEKSVPQYLAEQMTLRGPGTSYSSQEGLGICFDDEWVMDGSHQYWLLGKYKNNSLPWPLERFGETHMIHVRLIHRDKGWAVSVFNTHLAPRDWPERVKVRTEQLTKAMEIIRQTVRTGDLPPIFLGDFNFHTAESVNYNIVNEYFSLMNERGWGIPAANGRPYEVGIDHIWVGRPEKFSSIGNFIPLRCHTSDNSTIGIDLGEISDHSSPAISFRIEGAAPH